jgi:cytochrome P450
VPASGPRQVDGLLVAELRDQVGLFGAELDSDAEKIGRAVAEVGEFFDYLTIALLPVLLRTPLPSVRRFKRGIDELEGATSRVIAERRSAGNDDDGDLLSILLAAVTSRATGQA